MVVVIRICFKSDVESLYHTLKPEIDSQCDSKLLCLVKGLSIYWRDSVHILD